MCLKFLSKEAKLIVNYCVNIQKGNKALIWGPAEAFPLINEIYREILRAGGHPMTKINIPEQEYIFYKEAQDYQLEFQNQFDLYHAQNIDVAIMINGTSNSRELSNISPEKIRKAELAKMEFWKTGFMRQATGELKWVLCPYPLNSMAQEANMSKEEFAALIEKTCFLDKEDPSAEWQKLSKTQQKYCDYLNNVDKLHFIGKGTDITMSVKGRTWENLDGKKNMPDGEILSGPIEDSVNGVITFSFPGIYMGREVENIVLKFEKGKVVEAIASKGQELLEALLKIPGAKRIGEVAIGTNYGMTKFVKNILFDEKIGGTIHMALGNGYPETGSKNKSAIHVDLICDMREEGQIFTDGNLFYEKGKFVM